MCDLKKPGTALAMNRTNRTIYRIDLPCYDPIIDLDTQQARLNEAVEILSLLLSTVEVITPGEKTEQSIAGSACMLRRAINLISVKLDLMDQPDYLSDLSSATS